VSPVDCGQAGRIAAESDAVKVRAEVKRHAKTLDLETPFRVGLRPELTISGPQNLG
jgi:hypothetical protein